MSLCERIFRRQHRLWEYECERCGSRFVSERKHGQKKKHLKKGARPRRPCPVCRGHLKIVKVPESVRRSNTHPEIDQ